MVSHEDHHYENIIFEPIFLECVLGGQSKMTDAIDVHLVLLGKLMGNLNSLEFALRVYLSKKLGDESSIPNLMTLAEGDCVLENSFTNYDTLGKLIEKFNKSMLKEGSVDFVDPDIVKVRDAIAHGRVFSEEQNDSPMQLLKFSKPVNGSVRVEFSALMTPDWFKAEIRRVYAEVVKVYKLIV